MGFYFTFVSLKNKPPKSPSFPVSSVRRSRRGLFAGRVYLRLLFHQARHRASNSMTPALSAV